MRRRQSATALGTTRSSFQKVGRIGPASPLPFIGREDEMVALQAALERGPVCLVGAAGAGKSALGRALVHKASAAGRRAAMISCLVGDDVDALLGRAERALGLPPEGLTGGFAGADFLLVIDDAHRLGDGVRRLGRLPAGVLLLSEEQLTGAAHVPLSGLPPAAARALWMRLEEIFGPTPQGAVDVALTVTQGRPLALRREYARARLELDEPWDLAQLADDERRLLAAAAVLGPAPAAALGVAAGRPVEPALDGLIDRHLLTVMDDGRLAAHDVISAEVLAHLPRSERRRLEADAGSLVAGRAQAWQRIDGDAAPYDLCDRVLRAAGHFSQAELRDEATALLVENEAFLLESGAGRELRGVLERLARLGRDGTLTALTVRVLVATGQLNAAREVHELAGAPTPALRLAGAELALASGEPAAALARLEPLLREPSGDVENPLRKEACAMAALAELERGRMTAARARAREAGSHPSGRRAVELIEARDAGRIPTVDRLLAQGRRTEAEAQIAEAEKLAATAENRALAGELARRRAVIAAKAGRLGVAERELGAVATRARAMGQELLALRAEIDLATALLARGRSAAAAQIAAAVVEETTGRGLSLIAAEAELVLSLADLDGFRLHEAARTAAALMLSEFAPTYVRAAARRVATRAAAWLGETVAQRSEPTELDDLLVSAELAQLRGESDRALGFLVRATVAAERNGRTADLAAALADAARLHHARGDRHAAACSAARALTEGANGGADRTVARALLVTAALAREDGDLVRARTAATDALTVARAAELGLERYASAAAAETLARLAQDGASADTLATVARASAATLTEQAMTAAERLVADLGLSPTCAFRLISADGAVSYAAKMDASRLGLERKELVIDGSSELVLRLGKRVADLRRRTLLKRLLFLFAGAPGRLFTKEEIVERIWGVEYHPLHHDAALFTNVMRLRRLLGEGGPDILRVGEGGYLLVPPHDFLFIERLPV